MNLAIDPDNVSSYTKTLTDGFIVKSNTMKISDPTESVNGITVPYIKKGRWIPEINFIDFCTATHDVSEIDSVLLTHSDYYPGSVAYLSENQPERFDVELDSNLNMLGFFDARVFSPADDEWSDGCWNKLQDAIDPFVLINGGLVVYLPHQYAVSFMEASDESIVGLFLERIWPDDKF